MRFNHYNTFLIENIYHRLIIIQNHICPQNKTLFSQKDLSVNKKLPAPLPAPSITAPPTDQVITLFAFFDQ